MIIISNRIRFVKNIFKLFSSFFVPADPLPRGFEGKARLLSNDSLTILPLFGLTVNTLFDFFYPSAIFRFRYAGDLILLSRCALAHAMLSSSLPSSSILISCLVTGQALRNLPPCNHSQQNHHNINDFFVSVHFFSPRVSFLVAYPKSFCTFSFNLR